MKNMMKYMAKMHVTPVSWGSGLEKFSLNCPDLLTHLNFLK